jgi:hypothetical protein
MRAGKCYSQRSCGRFNPRRLLMRSQVGTVTTAVEAMAVGEVEVVVTCDLLREKGGKMGVVVMGWQINATTDVVSLGILPESAGP